LTIDVFFVKDFLSHNLPSIRPRAIKAAPETGVAGGYFLVHKKKDRVIVAIYENLFYVLGVARGLTFEPELLP
jgi:hypothetical protein